MDSETACWTSRVCTRVAPIRVCQVQFLWRNECLEERVLAYAGQAGGVQMEEILKLFNQHNIRYLLIGGQAVRLEGLPRFSMDWDVFIPPRDSGNIGKINALLGDILDLPVELIGPKGENFVQTYQTQYGIIQFHLGGPGLPPFDEADAAAVWHQSENGVPIRCLSAGHLLAAKKSANRPQDQLDIEFLEEKLKAQSPDKWISCYCGSVIKSGINYDKKGIYEFCK